LYRLPRPGCAHPAGTSPPGAKQRRDPGFTHPIEVFGVISPAMNPSRRRVLGGSSATIFESGFPALAITKVSPLTARSIDLEEMSLGFADLDGDPIDIIR
jgi:hypothetical protein